MYTYIFVHINASYFTVHGDCGVDKFDITARKASWNIEGVEPGNQDGPG